MSKFSVIDEKHKEMLSAVNALLSSADSIGISSVNDVRTSVDEGIRFLANETIPCCELMNAVVYPEIGEILGSLDSTKTMSYDIVEIRHLATELEKFRHVLNRNDELIEFEANRLRAVLYSLHAVVSLHIAKEMEIYLPLLDKRLTQEEVKALSSRLENALTALK